MIKIKIKQIANEAFEVIKSTSMSINKKKETSFMYSENIVCKIKKLPIDYYKNTVQHLINNILHNAELEKYNKPPQQYNYIMPYLQALQTFNTNQP